MMEYSDKKNDRKEENGGYFSSGGYNPPNGIADHIHYFYKGRMKQCLCHTSSENKEHFRF